MIDQTRLYRLSVVIEERNLSRAASRLGLTQPTLSASIAQFEQELGVKLLDRGRHGTFPTVYGSALYERSKVIEAELKRASESLREIASAEAGHLAIGATSGAGVSLTCQAVSRVLKQRPGITVELIEDWSTNLLFEKLRRRELDWVIATSMEAETADGLQHEPLFETRRVFVVRKNHPVLARRGPRTAALLEYPLVAPEQSNILGKQIEEIFVRIGGRTPRAGATGNSLALAKEIVLNSDHFAVMTEAVVQDDIKRGFLRMIEIPVPTAYWYGIYRHPQVSNTPTAKLFRSEIESVCNARGLLVSRPSARRVGEISS
jgi:DNA-binding transcriptional LysR family regulator